MEKTASQIQKERIKELEAKADALIVKCDVATLTSINEKNCLKRYIRSYRNLRRNKNKRYLVQNQVSLILCWWTLLDG